LLNLTTLTHSTARRAADRAVATANEMGLGQCIAIVDVGGNLLTYDRTDGAPLTSAQQCQDKAWTAACSSRATHEWWELMKDEPCLVHGLPKVARLTVYGGGLPIVIDGVLLGGVGVSGNGTMDDDRLMCEAAIEAISALVSNAGKQSDE